MRVVVILKLMRAPTCSSGASGVIYCLFTELKIVKVGGVSGQEKRGKN